MRFSGLSRSRLALAAILLAVAGLAAANCAVQRTPSADEVVVAEVLPQAFLEGGVQEQGEDVAAASHYECANSRSGPVLSPNDGCAAPRLSSIARCRFASGVSRG